MTEQQLRDHEMITNIWHMLRDFGDIRNDDLFLPVVHVVKKGEGLWDIARQYKVTIEEIVRWNGLKDTKVKVGDRLKIVKNP